MNFGLNLIWRRASPSRRRWLRRSLGAAARMICFGEAQTDEYLELSGLPAEQVATLLIPIDDRFFTPEPRPAPDGTKGSSRWARISRATTRPSRRPWSRST